MIFVSKSLTKYSEVAQNILNICPEAALHLIIKSWNYGRPSQNLKKAAKNLSKFIVDFIMRNNLQKL